MEIEQSTRFKLELQQAEDARRNGNEGMARVCARRAAGIVAGTYLLQHGMPDPGVSAYDRLRMLLSLSNLPEDVRTVTGHFLERVTTEHELPIEADLIAEARWLARRLSP